MSKGLEAIEELYKYLEDEYDMRGMKEIDFYKNVIEQELKDFEYLDNFFQKIKTRYGIDDLDYLEHICRQYEEFKKKDILDQLGTYLTRQIKEIEKNMEYGDYKAGYLAGLKETKRKLKEIFDESNND